jgi:hypothetical protein
MWEKISVGSAYSLVTLRHAQGQTQQAKYITQGLKYYEEKSSRWSFWRC